MSHLTLETLARLVDEAPAAEEAGHLAECAECRAELEALREQGEALQALPDLVPPPESAWPELAERLRRERLIREAPGPSRAAPWLRLAASVALFLLGGLAGFGVRARVAPAAAELPRIAATPAGAAAAGDPARALEAAEAAYIDALRRYAETATPQATNDPAARLAALEGILSTTRRALSQAPADPVINGYHLTALAQRDAALQQLVTTADERWY